MLGSAWVDGERRAVVAKDDMIGVTAIPGLDHAIAAGLDVAAQVERWVDASSVPLDAPLRPPVVFCLGQTYRSHLEEKAGLRDSPGADPATPGFFLKAGQTISRPGEPLRLDPSELVKLDYETELGIVIGRTARSVSAETALDYVFGYLVVNDLSDRDKQIRIAADGSSIVRVDLAKNFDGATVFSPYVQPAAAITDPNQLLLTTLLNGQLTQRESTRELLLSVAEQVSYVSKVITLRPGAVITTGTPGGTGWSMDPELGGTGVTPPGCAPGRYLRVGDRVDSAVAGVGSAAIEIIAS